MHSQSCITVKVEGTQQTLSYLLWTLKIFEIKLLRQQVIFTSKVTIWEQQRIVIGDVQSSVNHKHVQKTK